MVENSAIPPQGTEYFIFQGWTAYRAVVSENDSDPYEISAELCPKCVGKMRKAINPADWPRTRPALATAPHDVPSGARGLTRALENLLEANIRPGT